MSNQAVKKSALARNFSGAAKHYDAWATAQAEIASGLAHRMDRREPALMVDLGCGTGLLSALLLERYPKASLVGLDLAEGMAEACRKRWNGLDRARFVVGDAEDPACLVRGADLVACSCVAQWFSNPTGTLRMWGEALAPGGIMACAFLIQGSFVELESAYHQALQARFQGLRLWKAETAHDIGKAAGLRVLHCEEESILAGYDSARAALRSYKHIGAVFQGQPGHRPLGPAQMRRLLACYEQQADSQGRVTVTHRVQYFIAEKPR
ncbi:methyltransferase domain-containing protein [Desulfocurvibacter africanus]|uniref:methyltransferase domain-containing protein n=1 Tax=Desulfocurvibacter africanus TaxID=873 RepID=UPI0003FD7270|nr:methyltransferase domain-containing protein [Desulfocurvibacter africanus]